MKKNILITGTSAGIGEYLKDNLKTNFNIYSISRTKCNDNLHFDFDLSDFSLYDDFLHKIGDIKFDMIVLNAGIGVFGDFFENDIGEYIKIINTNLTSNIILLNKLKNHFNNQIKIVFIGSISGKKFMKYGACYQASKFGLRGFAGSLKNEFKNGKIHIINPKIVDTDFHNNSKIKFEFKKEMYTEKKDILKVVYDIVENKETRFEIDL